MDKEQAIEKLNDIRCHVKETGAEEQALVMAIDALKQPVATDTNVWNNSEIPNSSDTVSRQAAIDIVVFECGKWTGLAKEISKQLKQLPPAQPEPHEGHWINGKCDRCGEHAPFWAMASTYHESNYCPNCGAKMKGVKHESN